MFALVWVYGLMKLVRDSEFMLGRKFILFWIIYFCWGFIIPLSLIAVWFYFVFYAESLKYGKFLFPEWALGKLRNKYKIWGVARRTVGQRNK